MLRRAGFSLIELMVVITIIGILLGLLLPAVQMAREAARRLQCANHLKQIGLALHNHHNAKGAFPAGNFAQTTSCPGNPGPDAPSEDRANWLILILPYLEGEVLFDTYSLDEANESTINQQLRESAIAYYSCPSDEDGTTPMVPAMGPGSAGMKNVLYMPGSYRGMSGRSNDGKKFLDSGLDGAQYPRAWRGPLHVVGILGYQPETIADTHDGTSNTLLVGESCTHTNPGYRTFWAYSYSFYSLSAATLQSRTLLGDYDQCIQIGGTGSSFPCRRGWGSFHPGGLNFALCDGSVRFLPTTVDMDLFADLATIDGGEPALPPD